MCIRVDEPLDKWKSGKFLEWKQVRNEREMVEFLIIERK